LVVVEGCEPGETETYEKLREENRQLFFWVDIIVTLTSISVRDEDIRLRRKKPM